MLGPFTVANVGRKIRYQAEPEWRQRKGGERPRGLGMWGGVRVFIYRKEGYTEA